MKKDTTAGNDHNGAHDGTPHPEDVAGLYSWANLNGTRYRDFSASRDKSRTDTRDRNEQERLTLAQDAAPDASDDDPQESSSAPALRPADVRHPAPLTLSRPSAERAQTPAPGPRRLQPVDPRGPRMPTRGGPSRWVALKNVFDKEVDRREDETLSAVDLGVPSLAFVSLAGGVGKTSLAASLSSALAAEGENVLLVDTHAYSLLPLFFAQTALTSERLHAHTEGSAAGTIHVITMEPEPGEAGAAAELPLIEKVIRKAYGMNRILIDVTTGSPAILRQVLRLAPAVLVTLNPDMASVVSLQAVQHLFAELAEEIRRPIELFYVLNRFDPSLRLHMDVRALLTRQLGERLLPVVIHRDSAVSEALAEGMTVREYAPNSQVVEDLGSFARWVRELDEPATYTLPAARWRER